MKIYVADDDKDICYMIERQLVVDGFAVDTFYDGQELYETFIKTPCDLLITDVMMPKLNGFQLCQLIREISNVPIIIISANGEEEKRLQGYNLGSDDYLTKPFSLKELSLKSRNMLKRINNRSIYNNDINIHMIKDFIMKIHEHTAFIEEKRMNISEKEFQFLQILVESKNVALSRETIIEKIWGYGCVEDTRLLDHVVKRIRKKLIELDAKFRIETIWGYGYKVSDE